MEPPRSTTGSGLAVSEIARLVTELLDNGGTYSDAESLVELSERFARDRGLAIETRNGGAAESAASGIDPGRGLFVERLAGGRGIGVQVSSHTGLEVTVTVALATEPVVTEAATAGEPTDHAPSPEVPTSDVPTRQGPSGNQPSGNQQAPPAAPEPGQSTDPSGWREQDGLLDDLSRVGGSTDDTPIFNAMLSRWFTERRPSSSDADRDDWESEADVGWRAARAASRPVADELTAAGLPKRRPQAFLVPGGVPQAGMPNRRIPTADADAVRRRMSSYQLGIARGLQARTGNQSQAFAAGGDHGEPSWRLGLSAHVEHHRAEGTR